MSGDDILTVEQAAEFLQFTPSTVRDMANRGLLPGRRLGRFWRFSRRKLVEFIEAGNPPAASTNGARGGRPVSGADAQSAIDAFNNLREGPARRRVRAEGRP